MICIVHSRSSADGLDGIRILQRCIGQRIQCGAREISRVPLGMPTLALSGTLCQQQTDGNTVFTRVLPTSQTCARAKDADNTDTHSIGQPGCNTSQKAVPTGCPLALHHPPLLNKSTIVRCRVLFRVTRAISVDSVKSFAPKTRDFLPSRFELD